jgi:hypothetical protein
VTSGINRSDHLSMRVLWKAVVEGLHDVFPDPVRRSSRFPY